MAVTMMTGIFLYRGSFNHQASRQSVHLGHHHVHQNNIRLLSVGHVNGLLTVFSFKNSEILIQYRVQQTSYIRAHRQLSILSF